MKDKFSYLSYVLYGIYIYIYTLIALSLLILLSKKDVFLCELLWNNFLEC